MELEARVRVPLLTLMKRYSVFYMDELIAEVLDYEKGLEDFLRHTMLEIVEMPEAPQEPPKHAVWLDA